MSGHYVLQPASRVKQPVPAAPHAPANTKAPVDATGSGRRAPCDTDRLPQARSKPKPGIDPVAAAHGTRPQVDQRAALPCSAGPRHLGWTDPPLSLRSFRPVMASAPIGALTGPTPGAHAWTPARSSPRHAALSAPSKRTGVRLNTARSSPVCVCPATPKRQRERTKKPEPGRLLAKRCDQKPLAPGPAYGL